MEKIKHLVELDFLKENKYIEMVSPTYGKYTMRRILTIDTIKAREQFLLKEIYDFYHSLDLPSKKIVILDTFYVEIDGKIDELNKLTKFEVYTAFLEDNKDWVDPLYEKNNGVLKRLPIAFTETQFKNFLRKYITWNY